MIIPNNMRHVFGVLVLGVPPAQASRISIRARRSENVLPGIFIPAEIKLPAISFSHRRGVVSPWRGLLASPRHGARLIARRDKRMPPASLTHRDFRHSPRFLIGT